LLPDSPITLIANPVAGKGRTRRALRQAEALIRDAGLSVTMQLTTRPGHATELARRAAESDVGVVVAMGGDGTVREVAAGLFGSDSTLALIPMGSGDDFARSLGIPRTLPESFDLLSSGVVSACDVGEDAAGLFICLSGVGFAAEVAYEAVRSRVFRGSAGYFMGVFKALVGLRPFSMRLHVDDGPREMDALFALVQNTPYCGGGQWMAPDAKLDDGLFDIVVVKPVNRMELVRTLPKVYSGKHIGHPAIEVIRSSTARIETDAPLRKLLDGDVMGSEPLDSRVRAGALRVLTPQSSSLVSGGSSLTSSP
jgi:YegS/Rv2252/BmrU family lipid kinase